MYQIFQDKFRFLHFLISVFIIMLPLNAAGDDRVFLFELPGEMINISPFTVVLQDMNNGILIVSGETRYRNEGSIFVRGTSPRIQLLCDVNQYSIILVMPSTPVFDFSAVPSLDDLPKHDSFSDFLGARIKYQIDLDLNLGSNQENISTSLIPAAEQIDSGEFTIPLFLIKDRDNLDAIRNFEKFMVTIKPKIGGGIVIFDFDFERFGEALDILIEHCGEL